MIVKDMVYVCQKCKSKWCTSDIEMLPEWEADFYGEHLKGLLEKEYSVEDAWCRECAEKEDSIMLFDSKHPVVRYINQRKQYKSVVGNVFKEVTQRFLENITDEVLWQLNTEAFNWFVNGTKCGKRKAARAYCQDAEKQIKKYIEDEIYSDPNVAEEKAKLNLLKSSEINELVEKYDDRIWGLVSLKVNDDNEFMVYSEEPDDFFVWRVNKHIGKGMKELVETEGKISGRLWTDFLRDLAEIIGT